jgi:uncharacterized protein (DUF2249 family)
MTELPVREVLLDAREDIRRGVEPFARIMAAVDVLGEGEVLVLRVPFEPRPLYAVLARRGLAHEAERRAADDWWIRFRRAAPAEPGAPTAAPDEPTTTLDVRGLEPPQPMARILGALDGLAPGARLVVLHERRPMFLYPQLDARGLAHHTDEPEPGLVRIVVMRAPGHGPRGSCAPGP